MPEEGNFQPHSVNVDTDVTLDVFQKPFSEASDVS